MFISNAFAQGITGGGTESSLMTFLPLLLMFAVLYFIMIRPQMKRQKEHRNMLAAMAKGDEVIKTHKLAPSLIGLTRRLPVLNDECLIVRILCAIVQVCALTLSPTS